MNDLGQNLEPQDGSLGEGQESLRPVPPQPKPKKVRRHLPPVVVASIILSVSILLLGVLILTGLNHVADELYSSSSTTTENTIFK